MPVKEDYDKSVLVDVSGSGLLFSYNMDGPTVQLYTDVELKISWLNREIAVKGRVMRRYRDAGRIYVGVQFIDIDENDRQALLEYIYGEQYSGDVDERGFDLIDDEEENDEFLD
jgi:c-di-GMP-binding flagellar brake protein YcgR